MTEELKDTFKNESVNINELLMNGATIIDVRSEREFAFENNVGSINIPLQQITNQIELLKLKQPIVLCCASGMRSSIAVTQLKEHGLTQVYNGGGWHKITSPLEK